MTYDDKILSDTTIMASYDGVTYHRFWVSARILEYSLTSKW